MPARVPVNFFLLVIDLRRLLDNALTQPRPLRETPCAHRPLPALVHAALFSDAGSSAHTDSPRSLFSAKAPLGRLRPLGDPPQLN